MTVLELSQRLASLTDAHKECMILISRLSKLDAPNSDSARTELANVIHQSLRDAESELELLGAQVEDEVGDGAQVALKSKLGKVGEDLKIQNDLLLYAATDVTTALRRTHTLLQSELSRSQFATETLDASTAALQDLTHHYSAFDDIITSSRALISDLVRKNKSDRWYYQKAIQILLGLLVWILVRRLLWGPIYLVFGVPLKITWWGLSLVAGGLGIGGDGGRREIREGAGMGVPTRVEVVGIPESMLEKQTPAPVEEGEKSMREQVEDIIDAAEQLERVEMETEEPPSKNPKSRNMEYNPQEEEEEAKRQVREKSHPDPEKNHDEL
ncbi:hypothetical protein L873DRAFT_1840341 [Choiromyces venosus 120613-1]|uniref:Sec20 C-terminal domain-containing protein n=1 Tax=Choiromyces venosus 120613-1 TaxID=1336337 RepID=A0A3N4K2U9_9PEZI|nr:hypothetical protein L873DRAFT_1840341 [Choiromyces venosus 120613-1]